MSRARAGDLADLAVKTGEWHAAHSQDSNPSSSQVHGSGRSVARFGMPEMLNLTVIWAVIVSCVEERTPLLA